jgi:hypothetical protein
VSTDTLASSIRVPGTMQSDSEGDKNVDGYHSIGTLGGNIRRAEWVRINMVACMIEYGFPSYEALIESTRA